MLLVRVTEDTEHASEKTFYALNVYESVPQTNTGGQLE
jgi:hypothetical protein